MCGYWGSVESRKMTEERERADYITIFFVDAYTFTVSLGACDWNGFP